MRTMKFTATCDDETGPFQWTRAQLPFFLSLTAAGIRPPYTWAPRGAPFLLVALHKLRHGVNDSVRGPDCPVPPWSRTVGEPRGVRGFFHFREWVCIKRKGQESGDQPGPNNRVLRG